MHKQNEGPKERDCEQSMLCVRPRCLKHGEQHRQVVIFDKELQQTQSRATIFPKANERIENRNAIICAKNLNREEMKRENKNRTREQIEE